MTSNILISGTMRSGTTLMCSILNAHPNISLLSDILNWFLLRLYGKYGKFCTEYELYKAVYEFWPYIRHGLREDQIALFSDNIIQAETIKRGISYINLYETLVKYLYTGKLSEISGLKVTHAHNMYEVFLNDFPNSKIIHMVRNPINVYYSHKSRVKPNPKYRSHIYKFARDMFHGSKSYLAGKVVDQKLLDAGRLFFTPYVYKYPLKIINEWVVANQIALDLQHKYKNRILITHFEDLILSTESTIKKIISA